MGNWFTRALDTITPWNRGGEVERRKKREEEERRQVAPTPRPTPRQSGGLRVTQSRPTQNVSVDGYEEPEPKKTKNIFEDLNKNLTFNKPNNAVNVINDMAKPVERPQPGQVVQPRLQVTNSNARPNIKLPDFNAMGEEAQAKHLIERDLNAGKSWEDIARNNSLNPEYVKQHSQATRPNYGIKIEKPNQSIGNRFRDIFDANTEADKWRRQQGNIEKGEDKDVEWENPGNIVGRTPFVGHVTKALNTLGAQGAQLPATIQGKILTDMQSNVTRDLMEAQKRGDQLAYLEAKYKLDKIAAELEDVFRMQDAGMDQFAENSGGIFNTGTLYNPEQAREGTAETAIKDIALPTAVAMLDAYTMGKGNQIYGGVREGIKQKGIIEGTKAGVRTQAPNLVKAGVGNYGAGDLDARAQGATGLDPVKAGLLTSVLGTVPDIGLPAIARSLTRRLPSIKTKSKARPNVSFEGMDESVDALLKDTTPRQIPVKQNIPINQVPGESIGVPVRNMTEPKRLIQDVSGGEALATPNPLVRQNAQDIVDERGIAANNASRPNQAAIDRFEGVTPRKAEEPYKLDPEVVATGQAGMIDDYAKWLKEMGEGNGVNFVPDGEAYGYGKKRVTNNVRFGDTKGKRMTKQMWRDEAERQLKAGEAEPGLQKAFNEAADPEVQSLLARGEQAPVAKGKPIKVQEQKGIPVKDETVVPNQTPEAPGKVQVTTKTEPLKAKSEAVANTPVATAPVRNQATSMIPEIKDNTWWHGKRKLNEGRSDTFYSADKEVAGDYSIMNVGDKPNISKAKQDTLPKNPLVVDSKMDLIDTIGYKGDPLAEPAGTKVKFDDLAKQYAKAQGHDGILYRYGSFEAPELHAFGIESTPKVAEPKPLPKVGSTGPDGKVVTKRMVQSARNQRKLAKQFAKAQEETSEAISKLDSTKSGRQSGEGFAPTDKFGKGKNGNVYEKASNEAESARGQKAIANQSADDLIAEMSEKTSFEQFDVSRINEMRERLMKETGYRNRDDFKILDEFYKEAGTQRGQGLALYNRILRRNATGDRLTNQWYTRMSRVADDTLKVSDADFDAVAKANDNFTKLRDAEVGLDEQYLKTGSEKDFNAWQDAFRKSSQADIDAKTVELKAAQRALKGSKNENVAKVLADMEKEADLNMMDGLTASQLSGPATGVRNLMGTELAGVENRIGANTRAGVTNKLFNNRLVNKFRPGEVNVGGYNRKAARAGRVEGFNKFGDDIRRRSVYSGKNPLKHARNWATSVNSMGDSSLYSQADSRLGQYYKNQLKKVGYSGKDLDMRTAHAMAKDTDQMKGVFLDSAMKSSGLSGLYQKTQKIEKSLSASLEGALSGKLGPRASKVISKGIVRLGLGYPTATGNFVVQSGKRVALGVPSFIESGAKLARGDKQAAALAFDRGLKEAGGGAAAIGTGIALANADLISGFYPTDPEERQRWTDEQKSELSVKINGAWYPIPTQFGMFGLPLLVGAAMNDNGGTNPVDSYTKALSSVFGTPKNSSKLLPTDQLYGILQHIGGDSTENQLKSFAASTIRSFIPAGSLLAQTAKGLDETVNDTTTKDFWSNVRDQVISGIPGVNNKANIPDKLSSTGEPLKNPNLLQVYSGARTVEQSAGVENSKKVDSKINEALSKIDQYGLLNDPNMEGVIEGTAEDALIKANAGRQLNEAEIKSLKENMVKGVSSEGTDTAYLEKGQYDTNLAVLKMKRDLMNEDKTTKPSSLEKIETAIKRGEVYKEKQTSYKDIESYKSIGVEDWRKMGIGPEDDDHDPDMYDPDMYEKLWQLDQLMTSKGVSYGKKLDKNKYYLKEKKGGGGRGGSGQRKLGGDFGKLSSNKFGPQVKQYETIQTQTGGIPRIRVKRPNIVHKITQSR